MGAVVAKAVGYVLTAAKGMTLAKFVAGAALYAGVNYIAKSLVPKFENNEIETQTSTSRSPVGDRKIIYGETRVGGHLLFSAVGGKLISSEDGTDEMYQIYALSDQNRRKANLNTHKALEQVTQVYKNGELFATLDTSGNATIEPAFSEYEEYTYIKAYDGEQSTADDEFYLNVKNMTNAMRFKGIGYIIVRFKYNQDLFPLGFPNLSFVVKGRPVYDPRESSHDADDPATWEYSSNPVLCLLDYLRDPDYGLGLSMDSFDTTVLEASADHCDESVSYKDENDVTQSGVRYSCDGVVNTSNTIRSNIENLLSSFAGKMFYSSGKFFIYSTQDRTLENTIVDEDMMCGDISIVTKASRRNQYNSVKGTFPSKENNYLAASYPTQEDTTFISEDGQKLPLDLDLPFTVHNHIAQRIAKYTLNRSRNQATIRLTLGVNALRFKVGDVVRVKYAKFGYNTKSFEIQRLKIIPTGDKGIVVDVEGLEWNPDDIIWDVTDQIEFQIGSITRNYNPLFVDRPERITPVFIIGEDDFGNKTPKLEISIVGNPDEFVAQYRIHIYKVPDIYATGHERWLTDSMEFYLDKSYANRTAHVIDLVDRRAGIYRVTAQAVNVNGISSLARFGHFEISESERRLIDPTPPSTVVVQQTAPITEEPTVEDIVEVKQEAPVEEDTVIVQQVDNTGQVIDAITYNYKPTIQIYQIVTEFSKANTFLGYYNKLFVDVWLTTRARPNGAFSYNHISSFNGYSNLVSGTTKTVYTENQFASLKNNYVQYHSKKPIDSAPANEIQNILVYSNSFIDGKIQRAQTSVDPVYMVMVRFELPSSQLANVGTDRLMSKVEFKYTEPAPYNTVIPAGFSTSSGLTDNIIVDNKRQITIEHSR